MIAAKNKQNHHHQQVNDNTINNEYLIRKIEELEKQKCVHSSWRRSIAAVSNVTRTQSKSSQLFNLLLVVLFVVHVFAANNCIFAQKDDYLAYYPQDDNKQQQQIEANIDAKPVDGSTDEMYGQWKSRKPIGMVKETAGTNEASHPNDDDAKNPEMPFIRKFSWQKRPGTIVAAAGVQNMGQKQQMQQPQQRRKRPPTAQNGYDKVFAQQIAQDDVDRLSTAVGGDDRPTAMASTAAAFAIDNANFEEQPDHQSTETASFSNQMPLKFSTDGMVALNEFDLKSDDQLAKMMRRTTLRTREYPTVAATTAGTATSNAVTTTTPFPFFTLQAQQAEAAPSFALLPAMAFPSPPIVGAAGLGPSVSSMSIQAQQQIPNRRALRAEQFEQLGCGWDFISQSCKDVFRFGWCQSCVDFGNPFLHDCRCTAVTGLYVQTATFLGGGSSSSAARASAAGNGETNRTLSGGVAHAVPFLPGLPLLPTLEQLQSGLDSTTPIAQTLANTLQKQFPLQRQNNEAGNRMTAAAAIPPPPPPSPFNFLSSETIQQLQQQAIATLSPLMGIPTSSQTFGAFELMPNNVGGRAHQSVTTAHGNGGGGGNGVGKRKGENK